MDPQATPLPPGRQAILDRFVAACQADERLLAAFLLGSFARGSADAHSDLDLYLVVRDEAYQDFIAGRDAFIQLLGEPLFLEDFDIPGIVFVIFSDGTELELRYDPHSDFKDIRDGSHRVLLDKAGILQGAAIPQPEPDPAGQVELLRRLIYWFWHDLSHFIAAFDRAQWWWAYGQLEELRRYCVKLAILRYNFSAEVDSREIYFKVEQAIPVEQLSPLQATLCLQEPAAMLRSALDTVRFYQEVAPLLAQSHGIAYPMDLERLMLDRLVQL